MVSRCYGASQSRTLNREIPMLQSLIESGMFPSGIYVLRWLENAYFESQIPDGSKSHTVKHVP